MPENKINFTKAAIEALPIPEDGKRVWYWDTKVNGLAVRVSSKGRKVFYMYRWALGKPEQISLGPFPDLSIEQARKKVDHLNGAIALGGDPRKASGSTRGEKTFAELFAWYIQRVSTGEKQKKSWKQDENQYRWYFQGLAKMRLSHITKAEVRRLHAEIGTNNGIYAANKAIRLLRAIFNKAIKLDEYTGANPAIGIEEFKETSRDRRLMPSEIPAFLQALEDEPNEDLRDFVYLSLHTGARKSNVLAMRWDQIDFISRTWRIPETKTGDPQVIPLEDAELAILLNRRASSESPWVFPGTGATGHLVEPKKGWMRLRERAGMKDLRLHDLRRTLGSWMGDTGASLPVIGKALNHKSQATTAIYARLGLNPVREAKVKALSAIEKAGRVHE